MKISGFQWDQGNWPKCGKHGVSRAEIETLFVGNFASYPDVAHSHKEERHLAIGAVPNGRWLLVAFTLRIVAGETMLRPVSARYMHKKEVGRYEQQKET